MISERLQRLIQEIAYRRIADIGTDHGYVPIFAAREGKIDYAVACDCRPGPLSVLRANIQKYGLEDVVFPRLGYGLEPIVPGEADTAVLAGMGGMLMIEILDGRPEVTQSFSQLILQPQHDADRVRRWAHENGFMIANEEIVCEDRMFYFIIHAKKGKDRSYEERDYIWGKLSFERRSPLLAQHMEKEAEKFSKIIETLTPPQNKTQCDRLREVTRLHILTMEGLQCLSHLKL